MQPFQLAACAEMIWLDHPIDWRASRLKEMGFGVGLWNWPDHDLTKLEKTGAIFTIMNGYLPGRLTDDEGAAELLTTARQTAQVGKRLGVAPLNLSSYHDDHVAIGNPAKPDACWLQDHVLGHEPNAQQGTPAADDRCCQETGGHPAPSLGGRHRIPPDERGEARMT